jgi:outer membrane protein assembly factor BamB
MPEETMPDVSRDRRAERARRLRARRRRTAAGALVVVILIVGLVVATLSGGSPSPPRAHPVHPAHPVTAATASPARGPDSIEAGIEPWQTVSPVSREAVVASGTTLTVLGGISPAGTSLAQVTSIDPRTGAVTPAGSLATAVHDAAAAVIGPSAVVLGGGSPDTVPTIQSFPATPPGGRAGVAGGVIGQLPQPRSDLATASLPAPGDGHRSTIYVVGGYDGTTYLPSVLATTDGTHFTAAAQLPVPVRYPAVVADAGRIYAFGGQVRSNGVAAAATDDIQMIDPATHRATVVGHLPQALYGASAFLIGGSIYVAGGQVPGGTTLTQIVAFVPSTGRVLDAGLLPQADAFAGSATLGTGRAAIGYMVGGEVAAQSGNDQAGVASGSLSSVISLRLSSYGGPAGPTGAGSPYAGTLLIADRGNDRLIAINTQRAITWQYPSATMPPPPGGFYFPDDAFFIRGGTGIISNQEDNHTIVEIGYPSAPGYLDQPDDAYLLKSGTITVADASNNRILFISPQGQVTGQIGNGADAHVPPVSIAYPNGDTPLADGNVLVSEINGSWVDEYTPGGTLVWTVHIPSVVYPSDPQQVGPDLYLMTDYDPPAEGRALEFTRTGQVTWLYDAQAGDAMLKKPSLAERLPNGLIMINDDYRDRMVAIDPATDSIVWQYGLTDVPGTAPGLVSIPDGFDNLLANGTTPTHPVTG